MVAMTALIEVLFSERYELFYLSFESVHVLISFLSSYLLYKWSCICCVSKHKANSVALVREQTIPTDCRFSAKLVPTFAYRGRCVVSTTNPYDRILSFLDRSRYYFFHSRGWVDPVPDPLLLRKSASAGNRTRTSGSVTRSPDHQTTEVVICCPSTWINKELNWTKN
jgi:hypothetical protein